MNQSLQTPAEVVREYWRLMATNDFTSVGAVLADDYLLEWPQSNERIRGRDKFAAVNAEYPTTGTWTFIIHRIIGSDSEAASEVSVTDGVQKATVSFFTVTGGRIVRQLEYWPEPYDAPEGREHLVEAIR